MSGEEPTNQNNTEQNNKESEETSDPNKSPTKKSGGMGSFIISLLVPLFAFYIVSYKLYSSSFDDEVARVNIPSKIAILRVLLLVVLFVSMFANNTSAMKRNCPNGTKNLVRKVFFSTFIPFLFMMGTIVVALSVMPGWKAPFSNTLGYSLVKNAIFRKLFKLQDWLKDGDIEGNSELAKFNQRSNRTFFVNELTPDNYFQAIDSLNIEFKDVDYPVKKMLYNAIIIKDFISEFIWYFITAILTYSLSQIYILDTTCEPEVDDIIEDQEMNEMEEESSSF